MQTISCDECMSQIGLDTEPICSTDEKTYFIDDLKNPTEEAYVMISEYLSFTISDQDVLDAYTQVIPSESQQELLGEIDENIKEWVIIDHPKLVLYKNFHRLFLNS